MDTCSHIHARTITLTDTRRHTHKWKKVEGETEKKRNKGHRKEVGVVRRERCVKRGGRKRELRRGKGRWKRANAKWKRTGEESEWKEIKQGYREVSKMGKGRKKRHCKK